MNCWADEPEPAGGSRRAERWIAGVLIALALVAAGVCGMLLGGPD